MHSFIFLGLGITGIIAGFIDSIVGGGGLLTIPALLAVGLPAHTALGTNKLASAVGVLNATVVYWRKRLYRLQLWVAAVLIALIGAILGTVAIHYLSANWLSRLIPFVLLIIVIYMAIPKNTLHKGRGLDYQPKTKKITPLAVILGFYDGFFGPGTGSFWCTGLMFFFKLDILQATAIAKLMNFTSNVAAAVLFAVYGSINYPLAIALMLGYCLGAYIGAHSAIKHGRKLIKPLFLIVVSIIALSLAWHSWR